ncbi:MAG: PhnD/SsuA/transferrin family substrate-binding protein, partial [Phycisphaerales bacterium]
MAHRITAGIFLLAAVAVMGWLALRYLAPARAPDEPPGEVNLPVTAKEPCDVNVSRTRTTSDNIGEEEATPDANGTSLRMVVMDPLCAQLACDCVEGYAQRGYDRLATFLEKQLGRPARVTYGENLGEALGLNPGGVDLIIGKKSIVVFDAARAEINVRAVAGLTDKNGRATVTGLFVVRRDDPARTIEDLKGRRILFGPTDEVERSTAAIAALQSKGVPLPKQILTSPACSTAAIAVVENEADAAVISSYAVPLLEGCGTVEKGALRVVGRTAVVPFVTVFVTDKVTVEEEQAILNALLAVKDDRQLLVDMESRAGFVGISGQPGEAALSYPAASVVEWTDWRGPNRDGISQYVPGTVPVEPNFLWRRPLNGIA